MLNYSNAKRTVELSILSGNVPLLVGTGGVGKTQMMATIAREHGYDFHVIEGNLLKEGEVGGIPTITTYSDEELENMMRMRGQKRLTIEEVLETKKEYNKYMFLVQNGNLSNGQIEEIAEAVAKLRMIAKKKVEKHNDAYEEEKARLRDSLPKTKTVYSTFYVISDILEGLAKNPDKKHLLFIDEINRSSNAVMQELMNLILQHSINGVYLDPEKVLVTAAANPSSSFVDFRDTDYAVTELDPAQLSRLVIIPVDADAKEWINWATTHEDKDGNLVIQPEIAEFISSNPELLNKPKNDQDDNFCNPRGWEKVSHALKAVKENKTYTDTDLFNVTSGIIGSIAATTLIQHIRQSKNPLLKPEEIFVDGFMKDKEKQNKIANESYPRKLTLLNNCLRYASNEVKGCKDKKRITFITDIFLKLIGDDLCPKELMVSIMSNIINNKNHKRLNDILMDNNDYLDLYMDCHKATM